MLLMNLYRACSDEFNKPLPDDTDALHRLEPRKILFIISTSIDKALGPLSFLKPDRYRYRFRCSSLITESNGEFSD